MDRRDEDRAGRPRAPITKVGVCEPLPDGVWYLTGWGFESQGLARFFEGGCPYVHDDGVHVGVLGWLFTDLQAMSKAQMDLGSLESAARPPL